MQEPPAARRIERPLVLYDVDCGFCRWTTAGLLALDRAGRLEPMAIQDAAAAELLSGMDEESRLASWHLVTPDGRVRSAGTALVALVPALRGRPAPRRIARVPAWLAELAYALVAGWRSPLGRALPRPAVARATERIRRRSRPDSLIHGASATRCSR